MKSIFIFVVTMFVVFLLTLWGFSVSEKHECYRWKNNAKTLINFYMTAAEAEQCRFHGIQIDAPVK